MTTESQKIAETGYAKMLLDGRIEYESLEPCEPPDFWVRRRAGCPDIALEVVEYHPGTSRSHVEAIWRKDLEPLLVQKSAANLCDVSVHLSLMRGSRRVGRLATR